MNAEEEYVINIFRQSFTNCQSELLALYGLGHQTEVILNSFPDFNIAGILDGYRTTGELYGVKIRSLEEIEELGVRKIIVIARANSAKIIARRIGEFCRKNNIKVLDLHGKNLLKTTDYSGKNEPYFQLNIEYMRNLILSCEAISFDIFDTLFMRKVWQPSDVFSLLEKESGIKNFAQWRIQAEQELNRRCVPSLADIYQFMSSVHPELDISDLFQRELDLENRVLGVRYDVVELLNFALQAGKKVSLISDMYLTRKQIKMLLDKHDIKGYHYLFVSSAYGTNKMGNLFEIYKSEVPAKSYLHIGDDIDIDVEAAQRHGLKTCQLLKACDMLDISSYHWLAEYPQNLTERCILGLLIFKIFNSPFALYGSDGRPTLNEADELGYMMMGPILTSLVDWLLSNIKESVDCLLLAARDGYLIEKMCRIAKNCILDNKLPSIQYFLTSRTAAIAASIVNEQDLRYAANIPFSGTLQKLLQKRFFLSLDEIENPLEGEAVEEYVFRHKEVIFNRSAELRGNYRKYVKKLDIDCEKRLGFFDLVSSGTCQMCTESILERRVLGYYLIFVKEEYSRKKELQTNSFVEMGNLYELQSYLSTNYEPIEGAIVPNQGSLKAFTDIGSPVFLEDHRQLDELRYVHEVQKGILEFCLDYYQLIQSISADVSSDFADKLYSLLRDKYTIVVDGGFSQFKFRDDFCNREFILEDMFE